MPFRVWTSQPVSSVDFNDYIQEQVIASFPSASARDTGSGQWASPQEGAYSWLLDTNTPWVRRGGVWVPAPLGVIGTAVSTASIDLSALSDVTGCTVTVNLVTGRRYRITGFCYGQQITNTSANVYAIIVGPQVTGGNRRMFHQTAVGPNTAVTGGASWDLVSASTGSATYKIQALSTSSAYRIAAGDAQITVEDIGG